MDTERIRGPKDFSRSEKIMFSLYLDFKPLVGAKWFERLMNSIIYLNPLAILPQVVVVFTAESVSGIAVFMWYIFAAIQLAFVFHGIKVKSASVFFSMLISFLESATIIIVVCIRG